MEGRVGGDEGDGAFGTLGFFAVTQFIGDIHLDGAVGVDLLYTFLEAGDELGYLRVRRSTLELKTVDEVAQARVAEYETLTIRYRLGREVVL